MAMAARSRGLRASGHKTLPTGCGPPRRGELHERGGPFLGLEYSGQVGYTVAMEQRDAGAVGVEFDLASCPCCGNVPMAIKDQQGMWMIARWCWAGGKTPTFSTKRRAVDEWNEAVGRELAKDGA